MFGRKRPQNDFSDELRSHLQLEIDRLRNEGLSEEEAYWTARRMLGNLSAAGERFYEGSRWLWLEQTRQDTRHALRRLRHSPVFALTTVLTLALGIGAITSIFTLVHAVLLQSLPVSKPQQLYRVGKHAHCCVYGGYTQYQEFSIFSFELYRYFRDHTDGFSELAAFQGGGTDVGAKRVNHPEPAHTYRAEFVSGNYFAMFGVNAYRGRTITNDDDRAGSPPVAVMSYRLWQQQYARDPSIIGSAFNLDGKPFTIVGVTPPAFYGDSLRYVTPDFFVPLSTELLLEGDSSLLNQADGHWLDLIGRMRPGASPDVIQAKLRLELSQWLHSHWADMDANARKLLPKQTLYLSPGGAGIASMREQYEHWLNILMLASGFVLAIACANVANLMLLRGMEQRPQNSLSMALGARPARLLRQPLAESLALSILGGAAGLTVAFVGTRLILHFVFPPIEGMGGVPIQASPSGPILLFTFAVSLLTGLAFGIVPAWMATRVDPIEALRGSNRSTTRIGSLARKALVIFQAALSLVLLSSAGLLTATLRNLENQDFGFDQERRTLVNIDPQLGGYRVEQLAALYRRLHDSFAGLPGVASVAMCMYSPQSSDWYHSIYVDGQSTPGPNDDNSAGVDRVTSGFFEAIGNPILQGRGITEQDTANSQPVAVVNQAFAKKFFKQENPIGKFFGNSDPRATRLYEIVGVAKDASMVDDNSGKPIAPFFFLPEAQYTVYPKPEDTQSDSLTHYMHDVILVLKPGAAVSREQIRQVMASIDPNLPVNSIRSLREQVAGAFRQQRLIARLTSLFAIVSVVLAAIGIYGVIAYNAGRRTTEIGVRMALGANRLDVIGLILRSASALIILGLLFGLPLTYGAARVLGNQLYGTNPYDPVVMALAIMALTSTALIASFIPALRASLLSPLKALRSE
jgi:predicted permease